ncbi:acyl-CoA dehydrogenase family protein [Salinispora tropica]|uniref:Acyl-CoA dehydrogenase domain protein n=1 Tax=Salinispora tropica (strain ATCC BAA-916 / DSM 44818 / JCM 13857 / NBRC 105044 / CNB-440) TaxID=369723 RepID=A4X863_SALTO|nr:acyl-CoA dehydrogenase family protein [Salinispora tropica]ABP55063.1 acyl-CoA dehydrogenase domain protein [Salinispora tropica CNB-440]
MTAEQQALRMSVRGVLSRHTADRSIADVTESSAGDDAELWQVLCGQIGVAGLAVPERFGGLGAGLGEVHVVLDELGRTLTPTPMLGCAVLAGQAVLHAEDEAACRRILPDLVSGELLAALAWTDQHGDWDPHRPAYSATKAGRLTGEAHYVLDVHLADVLLVAAGTSEGVRLFEVDPRGAGVRRRPVTTVDLTRRLGVVVLDQALGRQLGGVNPLERVRDIACVALSAEQVGAAARALELTVAHALTRVQFGRPIGGFQAIAHRLADLHVVVESARSLSYAAVSSLDSDAPEAHLLAAGAAVHCAEALEQVTAEMIQLHGGIGITWEHDAHRYFKRAHGAAHLFGHPRAHLARLAEAVVDAEVSNA